MQANHSTYSALNNEAIAFNVNPLTASSTQVNPVTNVIDESSNLLKELQLLRPQVQKYCLAYLRHNDNAQEACQDTMLNAIQSLDKFQNRASLKTWVMKIAYHVCTGYYRRLRVQDDLFEAFDDALVLSDELTIDEVNPEITQLLASLSKVQREILRFRFVDDLSLNDIAVVLGYKLSKVKMNYYRALDKLQKGMKSAYSVY